jgi:small subunit ribosomal protein S16
MGAKRQPSYRVVVTNSESPRDGRFIEIIGFYNPRTDPPTIDLKVDRARYWLGVGAQPSDAVARMLQKAGVGELQPVAAPAGAEEMAEPAREPVAEHSADEA